QDALELLPRLICELVGTALEIQRERDRAWRHRGERAAEDVLEFVLARGVALRAAPGRASGGVGGVEGYVALGIVNEDLPDLAVLVGKQNYDILGGCATTQDQKRS